MAKIIELDEVLANQIAAGEVVENPASVVKELVENSIDAGATKINISVEDAGMQLIEIVDNGSGIEKEDIAIALKRHATSKIKSTDDLFRVATLGFRGEAIPSIASVSEFSIETSVDQENSGTKLEAKAGKIESIEPIAKREGSKITVKNLWFNTPVRLKFVKSLQAELAKITDIVNRISLTHPEIAFSLTSNGKQLTRTTGSGDLRQVVANIYGLAVAKKMRPIKAKDLDFEVEGYVSLPELTRSNRNYISLLINGRYIKKNFLLHKAILDGYGNRLMVGRFPLAVLSIKVDPQLTEVNVHPTKQEIRLSKEAELVQLIKEAVNHAFDSEQLIPDALINSAVNTAAPTAEKNEVTKSIPLSQNQSSNLYYDVEKQDFFVKEVPKFIENEIKTKAETEVAREEKIPVPEVENPVIQQSSFDFHEPTEQTDSALLLDHFPDLEYLAQMHATYLLCQSSEGLFLVDQHAAQERINYEYWAEKIGQVEIDQQALLIPYFFDLPKSEMMRFDLLKDQLEEVGIFLEEYGETQLILREHPIWLQEEDLEKTVQEMIDIVLDTSDFSLRSYRHDMACMVACKASIKAGQVLERASAESLIKELATCKNPYSCAHGRPSIIKFTGTEIERMFRRIQQGHMSKAASWKDLS